MDGTDDKGQPQARQAEDCPINSAYLADGKQPDLLEDKAIEDTSNVHKDGETQDQDPAKEAHAMEVSQNVS